MFYPAPKKKSKPVFNKTLQLICGKCGATVYHGRLNSLSFIVKYKVKACPECGKPLEIPVRLECVEVSLVKGKPYNNNEAYTPLVTEANG